MLLLIGMFYHVFTEVARFFYKIRCYICIYLQKKKPWNFLLAYGCYLVTFVRMIARPVNFGSSLNSTIADYYCLLYVRIAVSFYYSMFAVYGFCFITIMLI